MDWISGALIRRRQRFLIDLRLEDGALLTVHCPNTGTMEGCLEPGALVVASRALSEKRKYAYTAEWIRLAAGWVGINTLRSNQLVAAALRAGQVAELAGYAEVRPEVRCGPRSRIDFVLAGPGLPDCYVEVKNATWPTPDGGVGFPDAVTERGLKHLRELRALVRRGQRAVIFFLVNREDGSFFRASHERDPAYAAALRRAARAGVEVLAYRVRFELADGRPGGSWLVASLGEAVPCRLAAPPRARRA